ncbi:hypothetical protein F750_0311 [Streptomyces sp. PAMC 26508]|nr:hypothetical protein F750_0311 [Streptomyces sp. PAMC 26508]
MEERVAETVAKEFGNEPCTEPAQGYGHVLSEGDAPADRPPPDGTCPRARGFRTAQLNN